MSSLPGASTLALFLSNGGSLTRWKAEGILSREILLYLEFLRTGVFERVLVFSYDAADRALLETLVKADPTYARITLLTPASGRVAGAKAAIHGFTGVLQHLALLKTASWIKTNQISGAWAAVFASLVTPARLMIRLGYVLSRRFRLNGQGAKAALASMVEWAAFQAADRIVVTSEAAAAYLRENPSFAPKVDLSPTYVDVEHFTVKTEYRFDEPAIYVGRLEPQKNLANLIRACGKLGLALDIVGRGSLDAELRALAAEVGAKVQFLGLVPNEDLAELLRQHTLFMLPSVHEGLPKVLIEAMACGLVCVGSNIPGIVDLIEDGRNGYLIDGLAPEDIAATLTRALTEKNAELGRTARATVQDKFSLTRYAAHEAALYASQPH